MERKSGVLMHISSLFGDYSIGSFGKQAEYFIDFLADSGFSYWQVLPFCPTDEMNSPYKSCSTFAGNPYFVDLEKLYEKELITSDELEKATQKTPYLCEFDRLNGERCDLLLKASLRVTDRKKIETYIQKNPYLLSFCKYMADKNKDESISKSDALFMWKFIQYEFFTQWAQVKEYANKKGISIIGDIPIYVSADSCDVKDNKEQYLLDSDGNPAKVAGVPPDYFCEDGQLWGNPLYNWKEMKKDGYRWWKDRIKHMTALFDGVRIDHFRGVESYWAVPAKAETARSGKWVKGPGMELVKAIKEAAGDALIIAEDLGDITPQVANLVHKSGFPRMRVLQFGFLSEADSSHRPHNYPKNCVAYTGTHDNNTLVGYIWEMDDITLHRLFDYCGHKGDRQDALESIIRTMLASHASLVMFPIQDLLGFGADTRLNIPGNATGNWQFRITKEQLDSIDRGRFNYLNKLYSR